MLIKLNVNTPIGFPSCPHNQLFKAYNKFLHMAPYILNSQSSGYLLFLSQQPSPYPEA